jgi:hypothetical protein
MKIGKWLILIKAIALVQIDAKTLDWQANMRPEEHIISLPQEEDKELKIVLTDAPVIKLAATTYRRQLIKSSAILDHSKINLITNNLKLQTRRYHEGGHLLNFGRYETRLDLNYQFSEVPHQSYGTCQSICSITGGVLPENKEHLTDLKRLWPNKKQPFWVKTKTLAQIKNIYKTNYTILFDNVTLLPVNNLQGGQLPEVYGIEENSVVKIAADDISSRVQYWTSQGRDDYYKSQAFNIWTALTAQGAAKIFVAQAANILLPDQYYQNCICAQALTPNRKSLEKAKHLLKISETYLAKVPQRFEIERLREEAAPEMATIENLINSKTSTQPQTFFEDKDLNKIIIKNLTARDQRAVGSLLATVFVKSALFGISYLKNDEQAKMVIKNLADEVRHSVRIEKPKINTKFTDDKTFNTYLMDEMASSGFNLSKSQNEVFEFKISHKFSVLSNKHQLSEERAGRILQLARLLSYFEETISKQVPELLYQQIVTELQWTIADDNKKILCTIRHGHSYIIYNFFTEIIRSDLSTQVLTVAPLPHIRQDGLHQKYLIDFKSNELETKISLRCQNAALLGKNGKIKANCQTGLARQDFLQRKLTTDFFQLVQAQPKGALLTIKCSHRQEKNVILEKDVSLILAPKNCEFQIVHQSTVGSLASLGKSMLTGEHNPTIILSYDITGQNSQLTKIYLGLILSCVLCFLALITLAGIIFMIAGFLNKFKPVKLPETGSNEDLELKDIVKQPEKSRKMQPYPMGPDHIEVRT